MPNDYVANVDYGTKDGGRDSLTFTQDTPKGSVQAEVHDRGDGKSPVSVIWDTTGRYTAPSGRAKK